MITNEKCTKEKFEKWFKSPIIALCQFSDTDFAIMQLVFPLLERLLRAKSGISEDDNLNPKFYSELGYVFPELPNDEQNRKGFWNAFRNGLLHQAAMSTRRGYSASFNRSAQCIEFDSQNRIFKVAAPAVADRTIQAIEGDFSTFENATTNPHHRIPDVTPVSKTQETHSIAK